MSSIAAPKVVYCFVVYGRNYSKYFYPLECFVRTMLRTDEICAIACCENDLKYVETIFKRFENVRIVCFPNKYLTRARLLRFLLPLWVSGDIFHFRDSDSVVSQRERFYLESWNVLTYDILILRDHPLHFAPVLAGMVSIREKTALEFAKNLEGDFMSIDDLSHYYDQQYLTDNLYVNYLKNIFVFTSYWRYSGEKKFAVIPRDERKFIGLPEWWSDEDVMASFRGVSGSDDLKTLYFFRPLSSLYQRKKFVTLVGGVIKLFSKLGFFRT